MGGGAFPTWIRPRLSWIPALLLLLFAGLALRNGHGTGPFDWLTQAEEISRRFSQEGLRALGSSAAWADPRIPLAFLAIRLGLAPAVVLRVLQLLALAAALASVRLLQAAGDRWGRPAEDSDAAAATAGPAGNGLSSGTVAALLLCASPVFVRAVLDADPGLVPALVFLAASRNRLGVVAGAIGFGWSTGWSPWSWIALPLALSGGFLKGSQAVRRSLGMLILGIGLTALFQPTAVLHPMAWWREMVWSARLEGFGGTHTPFGIASGWSSLLGWLHIPALLLLLARAAGWPRRFRAGDWAPLAFVCLLLLSLPSAFSSTAPLLILLPWGAGEAGEAWQTIARKIGERRAPGGAFARAPAWLLAALMVVPLAWVAAAKYGHDTDHDATLQAAWQYLETHLEQGALVAHDLSLPRPAQSRLIWMSIPFHRVNPATQRGAYWTGWYASFDAIAISERTINRFLKSSEDVPEAIAFYSSLAKEAEGQPVFGERPGSRVRLIVRRPGAGEDLGPDWRARISAGPVGGLPGDFLARLGGALVQAGRTSGGTDLLAAALAAGYQDQGIYLNLGNGYLGLKRPLEAGRIFEEGSRKYPDSPELMYNLALVLVQMQYWDRAVRTLTDLRELWPRSARAAYLLGVALGNSGRQPAARAVLREALGLGPDGEQRERIEAALEALGEGQ